MKEVELIKQDYSLRLEQILDESWRIFKSQFVNNRNEINTEAPFQQHFAQIIRNIGELYSLNKDDLFRVDLETKHDNVKDKSKYIDITCGFLDKIKCAIELKFKTKDQGAPDLGRVGAYIDIEALEILILENKKFNIGKFYMITNSSAYTKQPKGHSSDFRTDDGCKTESGNFKLETEWKINNNKVSVNLRNSYTFEWEKAMRNSENWYFLELTVKPNN